MPETSTDVEQHAMRFVAKLDAAFQSQGVPNGIPEAMRKAVIATQWHFFVHRYLLEGDALHDADVDLEALLLAIYSDAVIWPVGPACERLPSTNPVPSYVLWLLHLLEVGPGQRVLEIGSAWGGSRGSSGVSWVPRGT